MLLTECHIVCKVSVPRIGPLAQLAIMLSNSTHCYWSFASVSVQLVTGACLWSSRLALATHNSMWDSSFTMLGWNNYWFGGFVLSAHNPKKAFKFRVTRPISNRMLCWQFVVSCWLSLLRRSYLISLLRNMVLIPLFPSNMTLVNYRELSNSLLYSLSLLLEIALKY